MKIGIIGAGITGISAAHRLRKLGYHDITLLEKASVIGGKVCTTSHQGRMYDVGAIGLATDLQDIYEMPLLEDITLVQIPSANILTANGKLESVMKYWLRSNSQASRIKLLTSLIQHQLTANNRLSIEHLTPAFQHLTQTTFKNAFASLFEPIYLGLGYGPISESPWYAQNLYIPVTTKRYILAALGLSRHGVYFCSNGLVKVFENLSEDFQIKLSTSVCEIRRFEQRVEVYLDGKGENDEKEVLTFDKVIATGTPVQLLHYLDATTEERELYGEVRYSPYISSLVDVSGPLFDGKRCLYFRPKSDGNVVLIFKPYSDAQGCVLYQLPSVSNKQAESEKRQAVREIEDMGGCVNKFISQHIWPHYHPHFTQEAIDKGVLRDLGQWQGQRSFFYIGACSAFEAIPRLAQSATDLVNKHFGANAKSNH